jgi:hypothetical protein
MCCVKLCVKAYNKYLNPIVAYPCIYVQCCLINAKLYICECLESMVYVFLSICFVWKNWMVQFSKPDVSVFLAKPDVPIFQTGVSGLGRKNICFSCFNFCETLVMCITYYWFTHIFVAPHRCIDIG